MNRLRPKPLEPGSSLLDRVEYVLQWLISLVVVDIKDHPAISGLLSAFLMFVPIYGIAFLIQFLTGHWK